MKGYEFLSFANNMGKNLSNKHSQKLLDSAKKYTKLYQIADKITSVSRKKSAKELPNNEIEEDVEIVTPKKSYISPEERQRIIDELRLVPKKDAYF